MNPTPKQAAFAQNVIAGMSYSDAYRAAYDCARMKTATVNRKASELMRNGKIAAMVENGRAEAAKAALWSRDKAIERLQGVNDAAYSAIVSSKVIRQADVNAFTASLDRLSSMAEAGGEIAPVFVFEREEVKA